MNPQDKHILAGYRKKCKISNLIGTEKTLLIFDYIIIIIVVVVVVVIIVIETRDTLTVIEIACRYETNTTKSLEYKETRYKKIKSELLTPQSNFQLIFLEVTSLCFVTKPIKTFRNFLKFININVFN